MALNIERMYQCLRSFDFAHLLVNELGWSSPIHSQPTPINPRHTRLEIARLSGISVFEITTLKGDIPDSETRDMLYKELMPLFHESLLIFLDKERAQSVWYWRKQEGNRPYKREYIYMQGQPEDLFFSKLDSITSDLLAPQEMSQPGRRKNDLLRPVSLEIVEAFDAQRLQFTRQIKGIEKEGERELYAMILLCRLMFLYFLQCRGFLDTGNASYLEAHLEKSTTDTYYQEFLLLLFDALSSPIFARREGSQEKLGIIPYLGGGLFSSHSVELRYSTIQISNEAFAQVFTFFSDYDWHIIDISTGNQQEITPDILGDIFEMYFNRQSQGSAYATPPEITEYFCKQTIQQSILDKMKWDGRFTKRQFSRSFQRFLDHLDAEQCRTLLFEVLPDLSILDPACGSGTFLLAALNTLLLIYSELISKIAHFDDPLLSAWVSTLHAYHPDRMYALKKQIITHNLFGVDLVDEAIELARLRLYLTLISSLENIENVEPLPDIDFNLATGNSLIGVLRLDEIEPDWPDVFLMDEYASLQERSELIATYREGTRYGEELQLLKENIAQKQGEAVAYLNHVLLAQFRQMQQKYGRRFARRFRRLLEQEATITHIERFSPFHWCYEFDQIMNKRGGFDVVITSPPWERQPADTSLTDYYQRLFYAFSSQYTHQGSLRNPDAIQDSLSTYRLFLERCYNLVHEGGYCGMIVPGGICTDEGAGRLRQLLFTDTRVTGLFGFENRKEILPGIDLRFELTLLSFEKGPSTTTFPSAFSRQVFEDLERFPEQNAITMSVDFVRRFSPDTLALGRFKGEEDISICEKMMAFPALKESIVGTWNLTLSSGVQLNLLSHLLLTEPKEDALPVYEGKMIQQFIQRAERPRYWVEREFLAQEEQRRFSPLTHFTRQWQQSGEHGYHLVFRSISASINGRTMIATILPPGLLINNTLNFVSSPFNAEDLLFLTSLLNSFIVDFALRLRVTTHLSLWAVLQIPIPRLTASDRYFRAIVIRAARLICISEDFKELWEDVMQKRWSREAVATKPVERDQLRAELDGLVAQVYNITEDDFNYILSTFPLISTPAKVAARNAYRDVKRGLVS